MHRLRSMPKTPTRAARTKKDATPYLPRSRSLVVLRDAAQGCHGCDLYRHATQAVFGEGRRHAAIMLVGEQPGDVEDRKGHPFVGPAGRVLVEAIAAAKLDRTSLFLTNAVKHFKWTPRGKRRIHSKPTHAEVMACRPWLEAELDVVAPGVVVCLGAVAAQSFFGSAFRVTKAFGERLHDDAGRTVIVTYHPSAILRMRTDEEREEARAALVSALRMARHLAREAA